MTGSSVYIRQLAGLKMPEGDKFPFFQSPEAEAKQGLAGCRPASAYAREQIWVQLRRDASDYWLY